MLAILFASAIELSGCASSRGDASPDRREADRPPDAQLILRVTPEEAEVYIDESYQGVASRWRDGTIPVRSGARRLELRAPGYFSERFDLQFAPNEALTLTLQLEPQLELPEEEPSRD